VGIQIMSFEEEFELGHLLFNERKCRSCGIKKDLLTDFYLTRKNSKGLPSAYSYECKECTKKRVTKTRRDRVDMPYNPVPRIKDVYPDW
jgi:hypothetical protein